METFAKSVPIFGIRQRQRNNVSAPINKIRDFRNRVLHHEPISWNLERLTETHEKIIKVMGWLNEDLPMIAKESDRVPQVINNARQLGI